MIGEPVCPEIPPFALTQEFASDTTKQIQWKAFLRKNKLNGAPFEDLITRLNGFLLPVLTENVKRLAWHPDSGWADRES